jgi:pimeloyl-ACP methyl ester carboxylesterase
MTSTSLRTVVQKRGADTLLVLLPGAYMTAEDYAAHFFPAVVRRELALDLVAVDLGLDAVSAGDALPAVLNQILLPARQTYRRVWLGGISLGGLLSLGLAADHPQAIDGLCLIAPYPGSRLTTNAITRAGGLDVWQATEEQLTDPEFRIYRWLKSPPADLPVFVGYGSEDRFEAGMQAIAERFPPAARLAVPGDHDWPAWCDLWELFLDRGLITP